RSFYKNSQAPLTVLFNFLSVDRGIDDTDLAMCQPYRLGGLIALKPGAMPHVAGVAGLQPAETARAGERMLDVGSAASVRPHPGLTGEVTCPRGRRRAG